MPEKPDRKRVLKSRNECVKKIAAKNLIPDPLNWHTHGEEQREALGKIFEEVGFVGFVLVRKSSQRGKYHIIDGHERVAMIMEQFGPDELVDCSVLDINEEEAKKILATHDSIGSMGGVDDALLAELMESVKFDDEDLQRIVNGALIHVDQAEEVGEVATDAKPDGGKETVPESNYVEQYGVIVICENEAGQKACYEKLIGEGYNCRVVTT